MSSKLGFLLRRTANEFHPAFIAQLIQVEPLQAPIALVKIHGASLSKFQVLNSFGYISTGSEGNCYKAVVEQVARAQSRSFRDELVELYDKGDAKQSHIT